MCYFPCKDRLTVIQPIYSISIHQHPEAQEVEVAGGLKMGAKSLCVPHEAWSLERARNRGRQGSYGSHQLEVVRTTWGSSGCSVEKYQGKSAMEDHQRIFELPNGSCPHRHCWLLPPQVCRGPIVTDWKKPGVHP
jgi:hypothetical protein